MGAEGNKSQPPAEQGHQIKVCCYDLVHPAVRGVQLVIKKRKKICCSSSFFSKISSTGESESKSVGFVS